MRHLSKNKVNRIVSMLVLACAVGGIYTAIPYPTLEISAASTVSDSTSQKMEDQLAALRKKQKEYDAQIQAAKANQASALEKKEYLDGKIDNLESQITTQNEYILQLNEDIKKKEQEIADAEKNISEKFENFKRRVRITYEGGNIQMLDVILNSKSIGEMLSNVEYAKSILAYDQELRQDLDKSRSELIENKKDLDNKISSAEDERKRLKNNQSSLESEKETQENYFYSAKQSEKEAEALKKKAEAAQNELNYELENYLKDLQAKQNTQYVGGVYAWPLPGSYTRITSYVGGRTSPITGRYEGHNGIDIPAPYGTNIYAANSGTVVKATYHYSYGNYVMIDHGGGSATLYAHSSKLLVSVGDHVNKGDVIAKIGSTGFSTGAHLHFTMYKNNSIVNPLDYYN